MHTYDDIYNGNTSIEEIEKEQKQFISNLSEITKGNLKTKPEDQLYTIENTKNLYDSRGKVVKLHNDFAKIRCEAMYKIKQGTRLKILTP